ncbi:2-oxoacid:acceptor oxidoreductase family protein [Methanococcoides sp. AM1]|uniref:2-oxoacid:acceptor oxidoreductase family protein n=1 Tax=Methanococcoides sp. AM1 TaxID=1201011 RepID=UPI0010842044|nr:2-oxoacid:acceptor oxidoreductase family protein [Methanococcoides sp. AM1]
MLRLRFHGRGGQGAKVASRVLGTAAFLNGYNAQDFPLYGAERRGAPITAFTRISRENIMERGLVSEPDIVIVMDETLLSDPQVMPLSGLKKGGVFFVNTPRSPLETKEGYGIEDHVITLDITKVSLDMIGKPVLSSLAAAVASRIAGIGEEALRGALEKELSGIMSDRELLGKNTEAALYCYNAVMPVQVKTAETIRERENVITIPFETARVSSPAINATGNTPLRRTGNWRVFRPVWNYDLCTRCMTCVARCPEGCIRLNEDGYPYADYDNCKGCMICAEECPAKAINKIREMHSRSGDSDQ